MGYVANKLIFYICDIEKKMVWQFYIGKTNYFFSSSKTFVTVPSVPLSITISPTIKIKTLWEHIENFNCILSSFYNNNNNKEKYF